MALAAQNSAPENPRNVSGFPSAFPTKDQRNSTAQDQLEIRWKRLETAKKLASRFWPGHCMEIPISESGSIELAWNDGDPHYRGLRWCNSRACPWDAERLAVVDRGRAEGYLRGWVDRGSSICMVAFTMSHHIGEDLTTTWNAHTKVLESLHKGRPWRRFVLKYGLAEFCYANEVTDGSSGYHKHQHRCWEMRASAALATVAGRIKLEHAMQREYLVLYLAALAKHKRTGSVAHALKLTIAAGEDSSVESAAKYITKLSAETMAGGMKSGKHGNQTMWELLDDVEDKTLSQAQRSRAAARFRMFAEQSKGKHWTYFSEAGKEEPEGEGEEEIPTEQEEETGGEVITIGCLEHAMLRHGGKMMFVLGLARNEGLEACRAFLASFCNPQRWSKEFIRRYSRYEPPDPPAHGPPSGNAPDRVVSLSDQLGDDDF